MGTLEASRETRAFHLAGKVYGGLIRRVTHPHSRAEAEFSVVIGILSSPTRLPGWPYAYHIGCFHLPGRFRRSSPTRAAKTLRSASFSINRIEPAGKPEALYVKLIGVGTELRLTRPPGSDTMPTWASDGR